MDSEKKYKHYKSCCQNAITKIIVEAENLSKNLNSNKGMDLIYLKAHIAELEHCYNDLIKSMSDF